MKRESAGAYKALLQRLQAPDPNEIMQVLDFVDQLSRKQNTTYEPGFDEYGQWYKLNLCSI